jgi:hypothetical protein
MIVTGSAFKLFAILIEHAFILAPVIKSKTVASVLTLILCLVAALLWSGFADYQRFSKKLTKR